MNIYIYAYVYAYIQGINVWIDTVSEKRDFCPRGKTILRPLSLVLRCHTYRATITHDASFQNFSHTDLYFLDQHNSETQSVLRLLSTLYYIFNLHV